MATLAPKVWSSIQKVAKKGKKMKKKSTTTLHQLFIHQLKDIYRVENTLVQTLPSLIANASDEKLKTALREHLAVTKKQAKRVEKVFASIHKKAQAKKCPGMMGILEEGKESMAQTASWAVRDAAIISGAQKVEHYEISAYGTLCAMAKTMWHDQALSILSEIMVEEKDADKLLSKLAEKWLNTTAANA